MVDDRFERDLQAAVRARDPGPPPTVFAQRIAAIPVREPGTMAARAGRNLPRFVQLAAAVALVGFSALVLMRPSSLVPAEVPPGIGAAPATIPFDPTIEGAGVYTGSSGVEIVAILIVASTVALLAILRVRRRALRGVVVGAAAAVVLGAVTINNYDGLESTGMIWYPGLGAVVTQPDEGNLGLDVRPSQVFIVEPSGILTFGFDIHNRGPFPITVLGILPDPRDLAFGRFIAAGWMGGESGISTVDPERFGPLTLEPGRYQVLIVAARASPCAVARDTSHEPFSAGAGVGEIQVAYETIGIRKVATLQLPEVVRISVDPDCRWDEVISSPAP